MEEQRTILLADMNSFFASCHQSEDSKLRNKPVIVGGVLNRPTQGLVIAASYEAKQRGVYTTMSVYEALKLCPDAIVVPRNHPLYSSYSSKIMSFLRLIGDTEVASIDEAYVDITARINEGETALAIAMYIQRTLWNKIRIPCSIGIGPNRIIAKMASEVKKPYGYVEMGIKKFCTFYHPQPIDKLHGCGKKTAEKLNKMDIHTIGDLAKANLLTMKNLLGSRGEMLVRSANGLSSSRINTEREKGDKTIGKESTFREAISDPDAHTKLAETLIEQLVKRLKAKSRRAKTISIVYKKERNGNSFSKSFTLPNPTDSIEEMNEIVQKLYTENLWETPLFLYGVRLSNIEDVVYEQLTLDDFHKML